jgi:hypothetical protein
VVQSFFSVTVLMSQSNRASCFSFFYVFCLWLPRAVVLYFFCYINETHTILYGSFNKIIFYN